MSKMIADQLHRIKIFASTHLTPERFLVISSSVFISTMFAFIIFVTLIPEQEKPSLGTYESPQFVVNADRDTFTPLITVWTSDIIQVEGRRCVNRKEVEVFNYQTFTKVNPETGVALNSVPGSTRVREEVTQEGEYRPTIRRVLIPLGVEDGTWRLDSIDVSTNDGVIKTWSTVFFEVKKAP